MAFKTYLRAIAFVPLLGLATCGKKDAMHTDFQGYVGNEYVTFSRFSDENDNTVNMLTVKKPDDTVIIYTDDFGNDLDIESVEIHRDDSRQEYLFSRPSQRRVVENGQKEFKDYLRKIKKSKR